MRLKFPIFSKYSIKNKHILKNFIFILIVILLFFSVLGVIDSVNASNVADEKTSNNSSVNIKLKNISQEDIYIGSKQLYKSIDLYRKLPKYVNISGRTYKTTVFLNLMTNSIVNKYNGNNSNITINYKVKSPKNPKGDNIKGKVSKNKWYSYSKQINDYIKKHNKAPKYLITSNGKKIQYQYYVFLFAKYLSKKKDKLSKYMKINVLEADPINHNGKAVELYSRYIKGTAKFYLGSTYKAPSNSKFIKKLAKKIIKGCKTNYQKAKAITTWVTENIKYSHYYNTKYGAKKTILKKKGNCVDISHVIVALLRASGIPTRYVHSTSKFTDGDISGHVWTQVLIKGKWVPMDGMNPINTLGYIINWNVNDYVIHSKSPSVGF